MSMPGAYLAVSIVYVVGNMHKHTEQKCRHMTDNNFDYI